MAPGPISYGRRISMLAATHPSAPAVRLSPLEGDERVVTWEEVDRSTNRLARLFSARGVGDTSLVAIVLPNSVEHLLSAVAAWKLGACVLPVNPRMTLRELDGLLSLASPALVVGDAQTSFPRLSTSEMRPNDLSPDPLPDVVPVPAKAIASGGSTGAPKLIVDPSPWAFELPTQHESDIGFRPGQVQLVAAPLYHNLAFHRAALGMFDDHELIVMERFDALHALELIERHGVEFVALVPTMMKRMADAATGRDFDLSTLEALFHSGAPCPVETKRRWIELIGAEGVFEAYGTTEGYGSTSITGPESVDRPGSVGRAHDCDLRILDEHDREVPPGTIGEIAFRAHEGAVTYRYVGADAIVATADGFLRTGDLGRVDADGYLYVADRRADLIVTGGVNVFPAEVESALIEHPAIEDVAVVGLPDPEWGRRVHAVVQVKEASATPAEHELDRHVRERLSAHKAPKSYEFVDRLPRAESGKIRRATLITERVGP